MEIQTITMDPRIAAIHFKDYRKKVREQRRSRIEEKRRELTQIELDDAMAMAAYREMVKGARLLNLASIFRNAGVDATKRLPPFAIARADWNTVRMHWREQHLFFTEGRESFVWFRSRRVQGRRVADRPAVFLPHGIFPAELTNTNWRESQRLPVVEHQRALVPSIPVHLRPNGDLADYWILWEAVWETLAPAPPEDPFLLKHIEGHIYTVLAQWDLTPLERQILDGHIA